MKRGDQINWNQVFYFSEIAACGSIKIAAEKLGLSPSTLSEHLSQLEQDLDVKLFDRQHRKISLTREGARLFNSARQMFESGKRFIDVVSPKGLGSYPVSIGLVPGPSYSFAHQIIRSFIDQAAESSVYVLRFKNEEIEDAILQGKLDFGFTDRKSNKPELRYWQIVSSDLRFFVSSKLPKRDLRQHLAALPLVICRSERSVSSAVEEVLEALELVPKSLVISEYPSLVEQMCRKGGGVVVLGRAHFEKDSSITMLGLPRQFPNLSEKLYACWAMESENLKTIKILKTLLERMSE
ncbi:MAG: LysR family transcriptional regulator [Oligoflexales bacterium]